MTLRPPRRRTPPTTRASKSVATHIPDVSLDGDPKRDRRMSLGQHLVELRRRFMISALAFIVCMVAAFFIADWVIDQLDNPIDTIAANGHGAAALTFTRVTMAFDMKLRIAASIGLILSAPIWLWQLWAYIMPAMKKKERIYTATFVSIAVPLFFAGVATGWFVLPHVIEVMASFVPDGSNYNQFFEANYYWDFVFKLLLTVGIAYVVPLFLVILNLAGVMTGKDILKGWRVAVLIATIFAAIATPGSDIISMLLLAAILIVLYLLAAAVALLFDRRRRKRDGDLLTPTAMA